ncbi:putative quinol monooxygenase [Pontivivens ytuae]|uniref:ABM domain-containing protein n=1 Tax=Pontivivens ytuae TaxID=2789856 RepID=A0A7S9LQJ8_9RHOB|nr:hypothetical protein [Pontivivens ytuae]QPH53413.1 hypothetical protein I0K15_16740 [Pontivivens ytuae]
MFFVATILEAKAGEGFSVYDVVGDAHDPVVSGSSGYSTYESFWSPRRPDTVYLFATFEDSHGYAAYLGSDAMQAQDAQIAPMLAGRKVHGFGKRGAVHG